MKGRHDWRNAVVTAAANVADDVRMIEFEVEGELSAFEPGSHTNVEVRAGAANLLRSYSCLPAPRGRIRVAVKLHEKSRGGSRYMWRLEPGAAVRLTAPENRFELSWRASSYLLVAGGIGITPIYGMAKALNRHGAPMRLVYGAGSRGRMAFANELQELLGDRAEFFCDDEGRTIDLKAGFERLPEGGELYICGPLGMLNAARETWAALGRPMSRFRCEVFGDSGLRPEVPFAVEVADLDKRVEVAPDQTLLDALAEAGVGMVWDCLRGECGLCAVEVLELDSEIDHRDVFLSDEEKRQGRRMCACVSRLVGGMARIDTGYRKS